MTDGGDRVDQSENSCGDNSMTESNDQYVEVYSTNVVRRSGDVQRIEVDVEYFDEGTAASRNKVRFGVTDGVASLESFETPIGTIRDLRVVPAAETVAKTIPGIQGVSHSFAVIEEQIDEGFRAVENRLEMTNVPEELEEGIEMERDG